MAEPLLEVEGLTASFATEDHGRITVIEDVSFSIPAGQSVGLVGESGCGKSVTAMSIMRLLPAGVARVESGRVLFDGADLLTLKDKAIRAVRGDRIGMIFQEPMTSLNPVFTVGFQLTEALRIHRNKRGDAAKREVAQALTRVGVGAAGKRMSQYPHELSGGLRQRVMIAMALVCGPKLLIADEPTTALDVTIQAQILKLIKGLQIDTHMSLLMITHDLGVVTQTCERVVVMYAGRVVEQAATRDLFRRPRHPYTAGLLQSIPRLGRKADMLDTIPGTVPGPERRGKGCRFAERCGHADERCQAEAPGLDARAGDHQVACWHPLA